MILLADVGNTTTVLAVGARHDSLPATDRPARPSPAGIAILERRRVPTPPAGEGGKVTAAARELATAHPGLPAVIVSVVPALTDLLREAWPAAHVVGEAGPFPFALGVSAPAAVGADRYANVAAAAAAGWTSALVVDCGTAVTFDVLRDGVFAGGLIAPGLELAARALGERAARLRPVPPAPCPLAPAPDTDTALRAGGFHVGAAGVVATARALAADLGDAPVVVTGGWGGMLRSPHLRPPAPAGWRWDPEWSLRGAAVLGLLAGA